jgi:hypothetical protein
MKSTLKRESKGLEVVKMEADGLSTDRGRESRLGAVAVPIGAGEGVRSRASPRRSGRPSPGWYFASLWRLVSMSCAGSQKAGWSFLKRRPPSEAAETLGRIERPARLRTSRQLVPQGGTAC